MSCNNIIDLSEKEPKLPQVIGKILLFVQDNGQAKIEWQGLHPSMIPGILAGVLSNMLTPNQEEQQAVQLPPSGLNGHKLRK